MADATAAIETNTIKALRSALWNSVAFQVIIVLLSSVALNDYTGPISLVALAGYWAAVFLRAAILRDSTKVTALDFHLLRWGYFWIYCLVILVYYVLVQLGLK